MHWPFLFFCFCLIAFAFSSFTLSIVTANYTQTPTGIVVGSVKDPNDAVIAGAQVTARNTTTGEMRSTSTDSKDNFKLEKLLPGKYALIVARAGFRSAELPVTVEGGRSQTVEIKLEVAETRAEIGVAAKGTIAPNANPHYRAMRDGELVEAYEVANLTLKRDVGFFTLKQGTLSFLAPVQRRVVVGVFTGEGEFTLKPALPLKAEYLKLATEKDIVAESFDRLVFCFTDLTYDEVKKQACSVSVEARAKDTLQDYRSRLHRNTETPRSRLESLMSGEAVENIEAKLLAEVYNPKRLPSFSAYIFGRKHGDLRFYLRPYGALPQLLSAEEVALINVHAQGKEEGI